MEPTGIAEHAYQIQEILATATLELTSDDHAVTVAVGPPGAVRDLRLSVSRSSARVSLPA